MSDPMQPLFDRLVGVIHEKVQPEFKAGAMVTLIVRFEGDPEADVYVSNDKDFEATKAAVDRAKAREVAYETTRY